MQVAAEHVQVLNPVNRSLPFPVTTSDEVKDMVTEEIRLRYWTVLSSNLQLQYHVLLQQSYTTKRLSTIEFFLFYFFFFGAFLKPQLATVPVSVLTWHHYCLLFFSTLS